jgi:hypothetical protein
LSPIHVGDAPDEPHKIQANSANLFCATKDVSIPIGYFLVEFLAAFMRVGAPFGPVVRAFFCLISKRNLQCQAPVSNHSSRALYGSSGEPVIR